MLTKTQLHQDIVEKMARMGPNWREILHTFRTSPAYQTWQRIPQNASHFYLVGKLSELHVRNALERAVCSLGANDHVDIEPIPDGATCAGYRFRRDSNGSFYAIEDFGEHSSINTDHTEMDLHALIDGIPTLFEIKILSNRKVEHDMMRQTHIDRVTDPLKRFYRTENVAYAFVLPTDRTYMSPTRIDFIKRNGLFIPLYTTMNAFRQEVAAMTPQLLRAPSTPATEHHPFRDLLKDFPV